MYISKKFSEKLEKHLWHGVFCESCGITDNSLLKVKSDKGAMLEIWPKKKLKEHLKLVLSSIRVGVVAKTDNEIYILSTVEIHSYFSF